MCLRDGVSLTSWATLIPVIPGIKTSHIIKSGKTCLMSSSPSLPPVAVKTSKSSYSRTSLRFSLMPLSSSMTTIFAMNLLETIETLWERFISLFQKKEPLLKPQPFHKVVEASNWRVGQGLWCGMLPPLSNRLYYLEIARTSYADRRELGIKPPPTHTFKLFYFSVTGNPPKKERVACFVCYCNCAHSGTVEDFNAVEVLGVAIAAHLQLISRQSRVRLGEQKLSLVEGSDFPRLVVEERSLPGVTLLGRQRPETIAYWQGFIAGEMEALKRNFQEDSKRRRGY